MVNDKSKKRNLNDFILVFLLVATSGIQFFYTNEEWIAIGLVYVFIIILIRNIKFDKSAILLISLFVIWEIIQFIYFGGFRLRSTLGTIGRLFFAYSVIKVVNKRFIDTYIDLMKYLSILSLLFYVMYFSADFVGILLSLAEKTPKPFFGQPEGVYAIHPNLILMNLHGSEFFPPRNSGPFWEPGAFSIFLNLAIILNAIQNKGRLFKNNQFFIIALISTLSTAGYLVFLFMLTSIIAVKSTVKFYYALMLLPISFFTISLVIELDFLLPKIVENFQVAESTTTSRFGSAYADLLLFDAHPILGYGRNLTAMYGTERFIHSVMHRNNGLTKLFVQWGLILSLIFLIQIYRSIVKLNYMYGNKHSYAIILFISLLMSSFSQGIFQYPFFMGFIFIQYINFNNFESLTTKLQKNIVS